MNDEDLDTEELLFEALYAEAVRHPYPIKRANPYPTRNQDSFIDPLMHAGTPREPRFALDKK